LFSDLSFFYTNDDVLLDQIMSGNVSGKPSPIVSFSSQILGTVFATLYESLPAGISYFGTAQILVGLLNLICLLFLIRNSTSNLGKNIGILAVFIVTPQLILAPTFTITASISTTTGIIGLTYCLTRLQKQYIVIIFLILYIIGYIFRPSSFVLANLMLVPGILLYFYLNRKKFKINWPLILLYASVVTSTILLDKLILHYRQFTISIKDYWEMQSMILNYNPASLILQQKIISGEAMKNIWTNVDFIVLNNWAYVNKHVFSLENFEKSLSYVKDWRGLSGFLNSDPKAVIGNLCNIVFSQYQIPLLILIILFIMFYGKNLTNLKFVFLFQFLINFSLLYYLSATLRVPDRLFYSFLIIIVFFIFLFNLLDNSHVSQNGNKNFLLYIIIFISIFHFTNVFGVNNLLKINNEKKYFQIFRETEIGLFSKNGIFIGPISFFPGNYQNSLSFSKVNQESSKRNITLSWANFSPSWNMQLYNNSLDQMNLLNSIAKKNNVYWISDSYLAEVLNYHMNDHKIYRGKLCSLKKLNGSDKAEIFTYQAKENDC